MDRCHAAAQEEKVGSQRSRESNVRETKRENELKRERRAHRDRDTDTVRDADEDAETEVDSETKSLRQRHSEHGGESKAGASTLTLVLALK